MRRILTTNVTASLIFMSAMTLGRSGHCDVPAALAPYLGDDVVAVASFDAAKFSIPAVLEELRRYGLVPEDQFSSARNDAEKAQSVFEQLPQAGIRRVFVLLRTSDIVAGGTTWIAIMKEGRQASSALEPIKQWLENARADRAIGDIADVIPRELAADDGVIVGAPTAERLQAVRKPNKQRESGDVADALENLTKADAGIVVFGDADTRRVVRELAPVAPAPFMELNGALLADGLKWTGITVKFPPSATVTAVLEAADEKTAGILNQAAGKALELLKAICVKEMADQAPAHRARALALLPMVELLRPKADGARLSLTLGDDPEEVEGLTKVFAPAVNSAREDARRSARINSFKQIALGMQNYASVRGALPPAASYDADGKPLLSWRVLILPYVDQQALYEQFHLDEPWDSEHNRTLIEKMPDIYGDSTRNGRTTSVVPVGEKTVFGGREGMRIQDIRDGASNTILLLETTPERAVIWTKPDDWEADLKNPLRGLKREDGPGFVAARVDGSVHTIPNTIDPGEFAKMLTPAGGETLP